MTENALTVDEWRQEQRERDDATNAILERIASAQGGIVTQLDDVLAQLGDASTSAEGAKAVADIAVQMLTDQKAAIATLQQTVADLIAAGGPTDLSAVAEQVAAIDANVDSAAAELHAATDPVAEPPVEG
jgi:hypothetical protein